MLSTTMEDIYDNIYHFTDSIMNQRTLENKIKDLTKEIEKIKIWADWYLDVKEMKRLIKERDELERRLSFYSHKE